MSIQWGVISGIDFSSVGGRGQGHMHVGGNDLEYQGISLYIDATFAMNYLMNCVH